VPKTNKLTDVLSADPSQHIWLRSSTFANDMKSYSPALEWAVGRMQKMFLQKKTTAAQCMGGAGGGKTTEDGGMLVFDVKRDGTKWTLMVSQFDKAHADAFRARAGKGDIDPSKEYFNPLGFTLKIDGNIWELSGETSASGFIQE
jgi:hypothetical protein